MKSTLFIARFALVVVVLLGSAGVAFSQSYPTKPIEIIVPFAPGGTGDTTARIVASYAAKKWGVSVNVVNIPGASCVTGMLQALTAKPNGYTILLDCNATTSFMFASRTDLPLKIEDRTYIGVATEEPLFFLTNNKTGWKELGDAIGFLKTKPDQFIWGAGSYGSGPMFAGVNLFTAAGVGMDKIKKSKMVIFEKGNAPSQQACVTGDVQFAMATMASVPSLLATGRIVVLGLNAPVRNKDYPNIPTTKDLGYPDARMTLWYGISGPKGLPDNIIKAWDSLLKGMASDPAGHALTGKVKLNWTYRSPTDTKASVMKEYEQAIPIAAAIGLRQ